MVYVGRYFSFFSDLFSTNLYGDLPKYLSWMKILAEIDKHFGELGLLLQNPDILSERGEENQLSKPQK